MTRDMITHEELAAELGITTDELTNLLERTGFIEKGPDGIFYMTEKGEAYMAEHGTEGNANILDLLETIAERLFKNEERILRLEDKLKVLDARLIPEN